MSPSAPARDIPQNAVDLEDPDRRRSQGAAGPARQGGDSKRSSKEEKALRAALAKVALRGVMVALRGGQVSLVSVPLDEKTLRALGRALATVKLPS